MINDIVEATKKRIDKVKTSNNAFYNAISKPRNGQFSIIAEIKLASPTEGVLGQKEDIYNRAKMYNTSGADAISVVTEPHFFKGDGVNIPQIKEQSPLPILRKDFIIDISQIYESKFLKADAVLLISRIIPNDQLKNFTQLCFDIGVEPVVEIYSEDEIPAAIESGTRVIGVNSRNLDTMKIDVPTALKVGAKLPEHITWLGFSGISNTETRKQFTDSGASGILIGTHLMKRGTISNFNFLL